MKVIIGTAIALLLAGILLSCQQAPKEQTLEKPIVSTPKTYEFDPVIEDLYASITFGEGQDPDYDKLKSQFLETAKLISINQEKPSVFSPDQFAEVLAKQIQSGAFTAFTENELAHKTQVFGNIAQRFSAYETFYTVNGEEKASRGINSIQLIKVGDRWKISSLVWNDETEGMKIPEEFLQ